MAKRKTAGRLLKDLKPLSGKGAGRKRKPAARDFSAEIEEGMRELRAGLWSRKHVALGPKLGDMTAITAHLCGLAAGVLGGEWANVRYRCTQERGGAVRSPTEGRRAAPGASGPAAARFRQRARGGGASLGGRPRCNRAKAAGPARGQGGHARCPRRLHHRGCIWGLTHCSALLNGALCGQRSPIGE